MTCFEALALLDGLVDGELDAMSRSRVEKHLASCDACAREADVLRTLILRAAELPEELTPPRDLWPAIARGIEAETRRAALVSSRWKKQSVQLFAAAAALVCAVALALLWHPSGTPTTEPRSLDTASPVKAMAIQAAYRDVDDELADIRLQLRTMLEERRDQISPATMDVIEENLAVIEESILRISAALEDTPGNPELNRLLLAACCSEVKLLQRATELPSVARES